MKWKLFTSFFLLTLTVFAQETIQKTDTFVVRFPLASATIQNSSELETFLRMFEQKKTRFQLFGYTDTTGSSGLNYRLATERINAVEDLIPLNPSEKMFLIYRANINEQVGGPGRSIKDEENRKVVVIAHYQEVLPKETVKKADEFELKLNTPINLNINFEPGLTLFLKESIPNLNYLLRIMQQDSTLKVELHGHVCCADNYPLSVQRANAVVNYLLKGGIDEQRVSAEGHSNRIRLVEEINKENQAKNRRVEAVFSR